jgi:hypothetical protein
VNRLKSVNHGSHITQAPLILFIPWDTLFSNAESRRVNSTPWGRKRDGKGIGIVKERKNNCIFLILNQKKFQIRTG